MIGPALEENLFLYGCTACTPPALSTLLATGEGSMAALSSISLHKSLLGFRRSNCKAKISAISVSGIGANNLFHSQFRYENGLRSGMRQRLYTVYASDTNPSAGDSPKKNKAEKSQASQGPPVLTILAGFVVFLVICWIVGSIVMWLVGLIGNVPRSK